ncbi:MAG: HEAT repeat domain-containing protein, partial [Verrucomicrobia bacterium]|nr:HEAT repeat domain-containing protein [Verrucomicrobiota bacterium]
MSRGGGKGMRTCRVIVTCCVVAMALRGVVAQQNDLKTLTQQLQSERPLDRIKAARALGETRNVEAVAPLVKCLSDANAGVQMTAGAALVKIGQPAVQPLIQCLSSANKDCRLTAARSLGDIGDRSAAEPLAKLLSDEDPSVRSAASLALEKLRVKPADPKPVRTTSRTVPFAPRPKLSGVEDTQDVVILIQRLQDKNQFTRSRAARTLGELKASEAVEPLGRALADKDFSVRASAKDALVKIGQPAVGPLVGSASHPSKEVRMAIAEALGKIGDKSAAAALRARLTDDDFMVRRHAASSLHKLGWTPATEDEQIAFAIALPDWRKLKSFGSKAVEPLLSAIQIAPAPELPSLLESLGETGDKRAADSIMAQLSHEHHDVRRAAVDALARLGDPKAIEPIVKCLDDDRAGVQNAAVRALKQFRWQPRNQDETIAFAIATHDVVMLTTLGKAASDKLIGFLSHKITDSRATAASALGKIGETRAVEPLIRLLGNPEEPVEVRNAAAEALGALGDPRAVVALKECLVDSKLSRNAVAALDKLQWSPQGLQEQIRYLVARRDQAALRAGWEDTRKILLADLKSADEKVSGNALRALIGLGMPDTAPNL